MAFFVFSPWSDATYARRVESRRQDIRTGIIKHAISNAFRSEKDDPIDLDDCIPVWTEDAPAAEEPVADPGQAIINSVALVEMLNEHFGGRDLRPTERRLNGKPSGR
jgi:hypothetical protein